MRTTLVASLLLFGVVVLPSRGEPGEGPPIELGLPAALRAQARVAGRYVEPALEGWLGVHQAADGRWSAADFDLWIHGLRIDREDRLPDRGEPRQDTAVTALALCAYLGAGYTHRGLHSQAAVVGRGLRWLKAQQADTGRFGPPGDVRTHALATLALTEAYGMTDSPLWHEPARRALAWLLAHQGSHGAWPRADAPGEDDLLGTLLAVLPIASCRLVEEYRREHDRSPAFALETDAACEPLRAWLAARTDAGTGVFRAPDASPARPEEHTLLLTAGGLIARILLGADARHDPVALAAARTLAEHPPTADAAVLAADLAYVWLGTIGVFQVGGRPWKIWNDHLKTAVLDGQRREPSPHDLRGSWDACGPWALSLGRIGATALAQMSMEVYYRYDRVLGAADGAATPRLFVERGTWRQSALPPHAARFEDGAGGALPIEAARVAAEVDGVRARVVLDLWVRNPGTRRREGRLRLRLPDGAAPYYLAFGASTWERAAPFAPVAAVRTDVAALRERGSGEWGATREARMAPTAPAREAYRRVVTRRKDPALLTWEGGGVFDLGVFPLEPGTLHRVVLGYETDLTTVGEARELDLSLPADVPDVAAAVRVRGGVVRAFPEGTLADGVVRWENPSERSIRVLVRTPPNVVLVGPDAAGRDHTAAWIRADLAALSPPEPVTRAVFLLDASASGRDAQFPIRLALLEALLGRNRNELREFAVLVFDTRTRRWREGFVENTLGNVADLTAFARALAPGGATDLEGALAEAARVEGTCDVFLLGDGTPTWGAREAEDLLAGWPSGRRIFAYRTGLAGESAPVLESLTETTGGALISLLGADDVPAAARAHRHGAWRLGALGIPGVSDLFAVGRPATVHDGQVLRLVGRGRPEAGASLALELTRGAERRTVRVPLPEAIASAMAARAYGHAAVVELEGLGGARRATAQAYATHYRVVRESASLVMLESEEDYRSFGLDEVDRAGRARDEPVLDALQAAQGPPTPARLEVRRGFATLLGRLLTASGPPLALPPPLLQGLGTLAPRRLALPERTARSPDEGARVVAREAGTRLDEHPADLEPLLAAAFDAIDAGRIAEAYRTLRAHVTQHPRSRLLLWQLARLAERLRLGDQALVWFETALAWPGHDDLVDIVATDYARFLRRVAAGRVRVGLDGFARARAWSLRDLDLMREADEVVLVSGHDPEHDVELAIVDPDGHRRYRMHDDREDGAFYVGRSERGEGPKMFVAPHAPPGAYGIEVALLPRTARSGPGPVRAQVVIVRDWGRSTERTIVRTVRLSEAGASVAVSAPRR